MLSFHTILVPTDFSEDAEAALQQATELAKATGGRIHLLHVYQFPVYVGAGPGMAYSVSAELIEDVRRHATARAQEVEERIRADGVSVKSEILEGPPSERIVDCAEREKADLIVMGTRGLTGLKHVFIGSVAERTLRHAPCPVMTVKVPAS